MPVAVFTDFDGTITLDDCNGALVARYLDPARKEAYDQAFVEGQMVLWRLLDASLRACDVPLAEAIAYLHGRVRLDPSFAAFHAWCGARGIPLEVLSAGTDAVVRSFLDAAGLPVPVTANRAAEGAACFGLEPLDAECPTGVDKAAIVRAARAAGAFTIFVGDGFSDRLAAPHADLVYAKDQLARWCARKGVAHVPVETFADIQADLEARLHGLPLG